MTLAEQMIKYRAEENISQTVLAERCNLTLQTVNSIENGKQDPSKLTEAKIRRVIERLEEHK